MTVKKLTLTPGVSRENSQYNSEGKWWAGDKIRFRQGTPEKIGGWARNTADQFLGRCRALFSWTTLGGRALLAIGTHLKYYVSFGDMYNDITPLRASATLTDPFDTKDGLTTVTVTDAAHGALTGDYVTFSGATAVGGLTLVGNYAVTVLTINTYTVTAATAATSTATGGGTVTADYEIRIGRETHGASYGWGAGSWGSSVWGSTTGEAALPRMWTQGNFGEDLVLGLRDGAIYYWDASAGFTSNRAVLLSTLPGASDVPLFNRAVLVSDVSRFVFAFGCNELGEIFIDPMLVRWSDQEDAAQWTPAVTNQAGGIRLSNGSEIVNALQVRQEILVWTDTALYSLQYIGAPLVWGVTLLASNISCISPNSMAVASGVVYWMGLDKFYKYDGTVTTLNCDLRSYVFNDFNYIQPYQIFSGTNEAFNEVWWFYCAEDSAAPDSYVVYNYLENIWYYGSMERTAWLDRGQIQYPRATDTNGRVLYHEYGVDDASGDDTVAIEAFVESAEFDLEDGDRFGFVYRILPDITFRGSTAANPQATLTLIPLKNSGAGYGTSVGGSDNASVVRSAVVPIEAFTGQVYVRVRGRQMILRLTSSTIGTTWQMGGMRIDMRVDGRAG